jgi:HAD superfamily hydrolase (TIGR01549 family)
MMSVRWSPFFKQLMMIGMLIAAVWLLFRVRVILTPFILALLLAYLVSLPVNWILRHTGWPRTPVVVGVHLLVVVAIIITPVLVIPRLLAMARSFGATLVNVIQALLAVSPKPIELGPTITIDLGPFYEPISQGLRNLLEPNLGTIQNLQGLLFPFATGAAVVVRSAVTTVVWGIFILIVSFYTVRDAPMWARFVAARIPEPLRPELRQLWLRLTQIWDAFVRGQLILGFLMGVIVWLVMTVLGVRSAPALGLMSGLLEFVPGVGPTIAALPGVIIALILGSTWLPLPNLWFAVVVALTYFLLSQFENLYLLPRVVGSRVALHPAVVIVGALAGAQLGGVLGILLAAPTIASLRVLLGYVACKLLDQEPFPVGAPPLSREAFWGELVRGRPVRAILFDLDGTLIETDEELVQALTQRLSFIQRVLPAVNLPRLVRRWLMLSEGFVNGLVTALDWLRLDNWLFRLKEPLQRWRAIRRPDHFAPVDGSLATLRSLAQRYSLGIVTSRSRQETAAFLTQYGLNDLFHVVITRDDVGRLKPNPVPVRLAAKQLGLPPEQCVLVGDTSVDVRAAKAAGALAVGVLCGFGDKNDFKGADLVIESTEQLAAWL